MPINDRVITTGRYSISMTTKFKWKTKDAYQGDNQNEQLVDSKKLFNSLHNIQVWVSNTDQRFFRCKPPSSTNLIDLIGQSRTDERTKMYFAADNKVIVETLPVSENRTLAFDLNGFYLYDTATHFLKSGIVTESIQTEEYGKFFLLKDEKRNCLKLRQSKEDLINRVMSLDYKKLKEDLKNLTQMEHIKGFEVSKPTEIALL